MGAETFIRTGQPEFDDLFPLVRSFLEQDVLDLQIDGQLIRGYRSPDARSLWIRDHGDMAGIFRHFEHDPISAVQHLSNATPRSRAFRPRGAGTRAEWTRLGRDRPVRG